MTWLEHQRQSEILALYYKAERLETAENAAYRWLALDSLPRFARMQLRGLLQDAEAH